MLLFDCIKCVIEILPIEVNTNISDEDIKIFTVRELVSDIYDVDLIKSKKDSFSPIALNEQMDE